jgi:alginate O-acetyltransferase complex protein AlgJ
MRIRLFRIPLAALPVVVGASVVVMSWAYLMWNTTIGELVPALRFRTDSTIAGVVQDATPLFSLRSLSQGEYQQWISRAVGRLSPVFKTAVRTKNQLYYALWGSSASDRVVVGREQQLFEPLYLTEYCSRDLAALRTRAENWAADIRRMQDVFTARGQAFLYVITPSKAAEYPQYIPANFHCPAAAEDRKGKLLVYDEILARHGIHYVDTASPLAAARQTYGIELFPRGGTHWNALGAALGTQALVAAVNRQLVGKVLTPFAFDWTVSNDPQGSDRDLLDIMNLPNPDRHYPVPELTYRSNPPAEGCRTVRIAAVAGSFLAGINDILTKQACRPEIDDWFYWDQKRIRHVGNRTVSLPVDADDRARSLLEADLVVFEENDAKLPGSEHGKAMMRAVEAVASGG